LITRDRATVLLAAFAASGIFLPSAVAAQSAQTGVVIDNVAPPEPPAQLTAAATVPDPLAPLDKPDPEPGEPSEAMVKVMNWVLATHDNGDVPYMIIDKVGAEVFVFDAAGQFMGKTPALVGSARGDDSAPGVGDRELSNIPKEDRTTPAGRFVAKFGHAYGGKKVLWVDYATSISMHPVITANKKERREQRLASPTTKDNRITYGCINVPTGFYKNVVSPLFTGTNGIVYILPDTQPLNAIFLALR
jgi:hypothetical protein